MYACVHSYVYLYLYLYLYVYTYTYTYAFMYMYNYVQVHVHTPYNIHRIVRRGDVRLREAYFRWNLTLSMDRYETEKQ